MLNLFLLCLSTLSYLHFILLGQAVLSSVVYPQSKNLTSFPPLATAPHHFHLLGPPRLPVADGFRPSPVRGPCGAPGVQPSAAVPAGHRQCPPGGQGRQQADPAPSPLLLPLHGLHPHHQGKAFHSRSCLLLLAQEEGEGPEQVRGSCLLPDRNA